MIQEFLESQEENKDQADEAHKIYLENQSLND